MGVIRHKIWSDLWHNKGRTIQVVLIIAVGAFTVGMILGGSQLMGQVFTQTWQRTTPAMIVFQVDPPIDDAQLDSIKRFAGIVEAEGEVSQGIKWRLSPADPWLAANLVARSDYDDQHLNTLALQNGHWPHGRVMAVEKGYDLQPGMPVYLEVEEKERGITLGGLMYNVATDPPFFGGNPTFYTTRDRFAELTGERGFSLIRATAAQYDVDKIKALADRLQQHLEKQGFEAEGAAAFGNSYTDPAKYPFLEIVDGLNFVLLFMSVAALILGLFLVFNTMTALISQQVNQIGVMKAIGAKTHQILFVYFSGVFLYGLLALLLALPLGALGASQMSAFMVGLFGLEPGPFQLSPLAVLAQAAIALLAPLLTAVIPVFAGARITVREAISSYGLGGVAGLLERLLAKFLFLPRLIALMLSNTFQNKGRVVLTQVTLVGSGVIFMTVMTTQSSMVYTFSEVMFSIFNFNVALAFEDDERISQVEALALAYPGVKSAEAWGQAGATLRLVGQPASNQDKRAFIMGVPLPSRLYLPQIRAGRWLQPGDTHAVVLNQKLAAEAEVGVGDWIIFDHGVNGESKWQVVGLQFNPIGENSAHVPRDMLLQELHQVGKAGSIWIETFHEDAASEAAIAKNLRAYYEAHQLKVSLQPAFEKDTAHQTVEAIMGRMAVIIYLLGIMALATALIGSIALSGVLSINVLERQREIGMMRAIGASSASIATLFIGEGLILGLLSWVIALPLSLPAGPVMTGALQSVVGTEIVYDYSEAGVLYWLVIMIVLSIAASWLPARSATRISVRESLAYQ